MKTKVAAIYGKQDIRIREFELPAITDNELLVSVISDSVCLSTWKAAALGAIINAYRTIWKNHPVITGHECAGIIVEVGKNLTDKYKKGQRFVLQPAMGLPSGYSAGYSYEYFGGNATYMIILRSRLTWDAFCLTTDLTLPPPHWQNRCAALLAPITQTIIRRLTSMSIVWGLSRGKHCPLACAGPMGIGAIDYAINGSIQPSRVVVVDIDEARLAQAKKLLPVELAAEKGLSLSM
jgi:threonine dehydrogenase-like Zn-dependent dehydrogenase